MKYITELGDTWDMIAKKVYGDETKAGLLMDNNRDLLEILIFDDGIELECPSVEVESDDIASYPSWRV